MLCMWDVTTHSILHRIHVHVCTCIRCVCTCMCVCMCAYVRHIITMSDCLSLSQEQLQWVQDSCHERRIIFKAPLPVDWVLSPTSVCGGVGVEL